MWGEGGHLTQRLRHNLPLPLPILPEDKRSDSTPGTLLPALLTVPPERWAVRRGAKAVTSLDWTPKPPGCGKQMVALVEHCEVHS